MTTKGFVRRLIKVSSGPHRPKIKVEGMFIGIATHGALLGNYSFLPVGLGLTS